jgi:uncharacterized protein YkwD
LPDRRLTDAERTAWIAEHGEMGGHFAIDLEIVQLVSEVRVQHGLSPVQMDETLMLAARFYAQTMAQWGRLGHNVGPYGSSANVAAAFGANLRWGGNGASTFAGSPQHVVERWMNSPGHRAYILSPEHRYVGAGSHVGSGPPRGFQYLFLSDRPSNR